MQYAWCRHKERKTTCKDRDIQDHVMTEAQVGMIHLYAKENQGSANITRG